MSTEDLRQLQRFDRHIEEVLFTADCTVWNEKKFAQILDGLLFIVKRTIEPTLQIILKPAWPVGTDSVYCRFLLEESSDQIGGCEEVEPFLLPSQNGFVVFFNNLEDSKRAAECLKGLQEEQEVGANNQILLSIPTETAASGTPEDNSWDQRVYLQNTRVIMAMIAVLLATIVLTVGLNPPSIIHTTLWMKIVFQITFWIGAVFSLTALLLLGVVTPTSFEMQSRIFRFGFMAISVAMICVVVAFAAITVSMASHLIANIIGGFIGLVGMLIFSYFASSRMRDVIFRVTNFRLTQHVDKSPYWLTVPS